MRTIAALKEGFERPGTSSSNQNRCYAVSRRERMGVLDPRGWGGRACKIGRGERLTTLTTACK